MATPAHPIPDVSLDVLEGEYQAGVCNIGRAEIARRRQAGFVGAGASVLLYAALVAAHTPRRARFLIALPAAGAASGFIQAQRHFCAGFGSRGVYNFGELGREDRVDDAEALAADRAASKLIGLQSLAAGVAVGVVAALLPIG